MLSPLRALLWPCELAARVAIQQQMPELFCRMHLVLSRKYQNSSPYAGTILCWQVVLSLSESPWALSFHLGPGVDCAAALEMRIRALTSHSTWRETPLGEKL